MRTPRPPHSRTFLARVSSLVTLVASAAAIAVAAVPASAQPPGAYGYVWANQPTTASYTPSPQNSKNSSTAPNAIVRNSIGNYSVRFYRLAGVGVGGGTVDVTGHGTSGYCKVGSWGPDSAAVVVNVLCFGAGGAAMDSEFDAIFAASYAPPTLGSYLWADQPTAASYTPNTFYQFNSGAGTDTVTRIGAGNYRVAIPGIGQNAGTVKVSGYGFDNTNCRVGNWSGTPTLYVNVLCINASGIASDAKYTLTWVNQGSLLAMAGGTWGDVLADNPTSASYTPNPIYQANSANASNTITRSAAGSYRVDFPGLGGTSGYVQVSAFTTNAVCNSTLWVGDGSGGAAVYVNCYNPAGVATDAYFTVQYGV